MTEQEWEKFRKDYDFIFTRAKTVASFEGKRFNSCAAITNIDEDGVYFSWTEPCGRGCCHESYYYALYVYYLQMNEEEIRENVEQVKVIQAEIDAKKKATEAAEAEVKRVEDEKKREENDRVKYLELKAKYENEL